MKRRRQFIAPILLIAVFVPVSFAAASHEVLWLCWVSLAFLLGALLWLLFATPATKSVGGESIITGFRHTGLWRSPQNPGAGMIAMGGGGGNDGDGGGGDG